MFRFMKMYGVVLLACAAVATSAEAGPKSPTLVVTMTNDATTNALKVYDATTHALVQTLSTRGKGGVAGSARAVRQFDDELVAVVNHGSQTVALFRRDGRGLEFQRLLTTTSAPVSIDFGNDHMYVAGTTTVDSFPIHGHNVGFLDGSTWLAVAGGGAPLEGSTAQVGVLNDSRLLVTLKTDPEPGTVNVVRLRDGAVSGDAPDVVSAPAGTLTPFGFSTYKDGTALITLAHSSQVGLFRNGAFTSVIDAGQAADCWTTRVGKYVFTANTGSKTISRLVGTGNRVFVDATVAGMVPTGAPSDLDANAGVLGVVDHGAGASHLTLFTYNRFGELAAAGAAVTIGVANANGVAILGPSDHDERW